jgi:hypothetical protein
VFKEMDRNAEKFPENSSKLPEPAPVKAAPTVQLFPDTISAPGERVVIKETVN